MPSTHPHPHYMARALRLAEQGLWTTDPNPRVGCVLVRDGEVVGEGWHRAAGEPHAEVNALRAAGERARGADCYVTLEPCCHHGRTPPCSLALIEAGVKRVVAAMPDPNPLVAGRGLRQLRDAGIDTLSGVLQAQAEALNPGFIRRMRDGRPLLRCKLAMSLDGRTAMANGESQWITSPAARRDVQALRARSSALLTGVGTVLADDPSLSVRREDLPDTHPLPEPLRQPLRVVVDRDLQTPPGAKLLGLPGKTLVVTGRDRPSARLALQHAGAEVLVLAGADGGVDWSALLSELARREVNEVLVECGAVLAGNLLQAGLLDEVVVYMAPVLMGDSARGLFHLPGLNRMAQKIPLLINEIRAVGADWRISFRVAPVTSDSAD